MRNFSVVVPVHQEAGYLEGFLKELLAVLESLGLRERCLEILFIENGSTDGSAEMCRRLARENARVQCRVVPGRSYGRALRCGIREARGDDLLILECDCVEAGFISQALMLLDSGAADLVIGSKPLAGKGRRPFFRGVLTFLMNGMLRLFTGYRGTDTRGLKAGHGSLFQELERSAVMDGEAFQTELVLLAWKMGKKIREVPVLAEEKRPPRLSLIRRSLGMIPDLFRLKKSLQRYGGGAL